MDDSKLQEIYRIIDRLTNEQLLQVSDYVDARLKQLKMIEADETRSDTNSEASSKP